MKLHAYNFSNFYISPITSHLQSLTIYLFPPLSKYFIYPLICRKIMHKGLIIVLYL